MVSYSRNPNYLCCTLKKLLYIVTVLLYLATTSGVKVNLHYCMGSYQSFDLYSNHSDECGKCGMSLESPNGCCKNELKIVKLQVDQSTSFIGYSINHIEAPSVISSGFTLVSPIASQNLYTPVNYVPPDPSGPVLYVRNRVFRI